MKRQQTWEVFVCGWAYEFLNYVSKVILVDIVGWWLMLLCLLLLNLWLWLSVIGIKVLIWGLSLIVIKRVFIYLLLLLFYFLFFYDGFGDLVRKLVEVFAGWENKRNKKLKVVCLSRKWKKMGEKKIYIFKCFIPCKKLDFY